jgi:hypothetical protein
MLQQWITKIGFKYKINVIFRIDLQIISISFNSSTWTNEWIPNENRSTIQYARVNAAVPLLVTGTCLYGTDRMQDYSNNPRHDSTDSCLLILLPNAQTGRFPRGCTGRLYPHCWPLYEWVGPTVLRLLELQRGAASSFTGTSRCQVRYRYGTRYLVPYRRT